MLKRLIIALVGCLIFSSFIYFLFSFAELSLHPEGWSESARMLFSYMVGTLSPFVFFAVMSYPEDFL